MIKANIEKYNILKEINKMVEYITNPIELINNITLENNNFYREILRKDKWNNKIFNEIIVNKNQELKNIIFKQDKLNYDWKNISLWVKQNKTHKIMIDIIRDKNIKNLLTDNLLNNIKNKYIKILLNKENIILIFINSCNNKNFNMINYIFNNKIDILISLLNTTIIDIYFICCYNALIYTGNNNILNILNNNFILYNEIITQNKKELASQITYLMFYYFKLYYDLKNVNDNNIVLLNHINNINIKYWDKVLSKIYYNILNSNNDIYKNIDLEYRPIYNNSQLGIILLDCISLNKKKTKIYEELMNKQKPETKIFFNSCFIYSCINNDINFVYYILCKYKQEFILNCNIKMIDIYYNFYENYKKLIYKKDYNFNYINYDLIYTLLHTNNLNINQKKILNRLLFHYFNEKSNFDNYTLYHKKLFDMIYELENNYMTCIDYIQYNLLIIKQIIFTPLNDEKNYIKLFKFIKNKNQSNHDKIITETIYLLEFIFNDLDISINERFYNNILLIIKLMIELIEIGKIDINKICIKKIWFFLSSYYIIYLTTRDFKQDYNNNDNKFVELFERILKINNKNINNIITNKFNFLEYILYYFYTYHSNKVINYNLINILLMNNARINIKNFYLIMPDIKETNFNNFDYDYIIRLDYIIDKDSKIIYDNLFQRMYKNQRMYNKIIPTKFKLYNKNVNKFDDGQDIKGISKTIFNELCKELESNTLDINVKLQDKILLFDEETSYYNFNRYNTRYEYYIFIGKIFNLSIHYNIPLHIKLHPFILYQIIKNDNIIGASYMILEKFIQEHYKHLLNKKPFNLINYDIFKQNNVYENIDDEYIEVRFENIKQYIKNYIYDNYYIDIKQQLEHFKLGFNDFSLINKQYLNYFNINDIERLIIGISNIDFNLLKKHLTIFLYENKLEETEIIWKILQEYSNDKEYISVFLEFCTGTPYIPLNGYTSFPLRIIIDDINNIISCHTCFNYFNINEIEYNKLCYLYINNIDELKNNKLYQYLSKISLQNIINNGYILF
jgi:hypothetical protein